MAIKVILAPTGLGHSDADAKAALQLAATGDAHLSLCVVALSVPPPIGEYSMVMAEGWVEERTEVARRLKARVEALDAMLASRGVAGDVDGAGIELSAADVEIGRRGRLADLTLIGPELLADPDLRSMVIEGALFESGRAVLLAPAGSVPTLAPRQVVLAWDGRVEAARAMREALPFLRTAEKVHVTLVDPDATREQGIEPGADVATYLSRQGIDASVSRLSGGGLPVASVLARHATDIGADLIVMGGYGHSRLRERIFGGVTRTMVTETPLPVLLAR